MDPWNSVSKLSRDFHCGVRVNQDRGVFFGLGVSTSVARGYALVNQYPKLFFVSNRLQTLLFCPRQATTDAASDHKGGAGDAQGSGLSARQRNRMSRQGRVPSFSASASARKRRRQPIEAESGVEEGKEGGGGDGKESDAGSAIEPAAFLWRGGGMIEAADDARGALVSLAADLVTQVRVCEDSGLWARHRRATTRIPPPSGLWKACPG